MSKKRLLLILNPLAGKKKAKKAMSGIIKLYKDAGYVVTCIFTKRRFHATKIVTKKSRKYDVVVCCGGDGTLNEVLTGLAKVKKPPVLGYIPTGSTNDFANGLRLPKNIINAAKKVLDGKIYEIDLGRFNERPFAYIASFGAFTNISYATPQAMKNLWGHLAYVMEGIKDIPNIKPYHVRVEANGKVYEDDYIFGAVTNAMSIGGIIRLDPKVAKLDDGLFEIMLIKAPKTASEMQRIIGCLVSRRFDDGIIEFFHAANLKVNAPEEMNWSLDGEFAKGEKEIILKNINKAIKIYY